MSMLNSMPEIQDDVYLKQVMDTLERYRCDLDEQQRKNTTADDEASQLHWLLNMAYQFAAVKKTA